MDPEQAYASKYYIVFFGKKRRPFLFMIEIKGLQYPRNNHTFLYFFREGRQLLHKGINYSNINFNQN